MSIPLPEHYEIKLLSGPEFGPLWTIHAKKIFDESQLIFRPYDFLSESELKKTDLLKKNFRDILRIRLGLFFKGDFVGWSWGFQESAESFYMCNSAVLPDHRRQGLYTALMQTLLHAAIDAGFQHIYSRHTTTNNAVIIPKLKAGFYITQFEISDTFGALVHLGYFPNALRNKVLNFRVGQMKPDEEVIKALGLQLKPENT